MFYRIKLIVGIITMLILSYSSYSQDNIKQSSIDSDIRKVEALHKYRKSSETLKVAYSIIQQSNTIKYEAGLAYGNYYLACAYFDLYHTDSAIHYMSIALSGFEKLQIKKYLVKSLNMLGHFYRFIDMNDTSIIFHKQAYQISKRLQDTELLADSYWGLGRTQLQMGNFIDAIDLYTDALDLRKNSDNKQGIADILNSIGISFRQQGNLSSALDFQLRAINIRYEINDSIGLAYQHNNIGLIYKDLKNYPKSFEHLKHSIEIKDKLHDIRGLSNSYMNIGSVYIALNQLDSAMIALDIAERIKSDLMEFGGLTSIYCYKGEIYRQLKQYKKSIDILTKAHSNSIKYKEPKHEAEASCQLAITYMECGQFNKATVLINSTNAIASKLGLLNIQEKMYKSLYQFYRNHNDFKNTLEYYSKYITIRDSILKQDNIKHMLSIQLRDEFDNKIKIQNAINEQKIREIAIENKHKTKMFYSLLAVLIFVGGVLILYIHLFKHKQQIIIELNEQQRQNIQQKEEIIQQRDQILSILNDISESIDYAKQIQQAVLPSPKNIDKFLTDYFILYEPRSIVGGDFYWIKEYNGFHIFAAADSTGHGIPGGFMSMLGMSLLNELLSNIKVLSPNLILDILREYTITSLNQTKQDDFNYDGMDIALCIYDPKSHTLSYAGANLPIMVYTQNQLTETKKVVKRLPNFYELMPDRMPISIYKTMLPFNSITIQLQPNDKIYLYSDGYADQFGGPKNKKFGRTAFNQTIYNNIDKPMKQQQNILLNTIKNWKEQSEFQTDDILVIGVKL